MERKLWILSAFIVGIVVGALGAGFGVALGVGLYLKRCNEVSNISLGTTTLSTTTTPSRTTTSTTTTRSPPPADYIYSNQNFGSFYYKFGINDVETEGVWVDNDGKRISYQNWRYGEPNNVDGGEDAVCIPRQDSLRNNLKWNDHGIFNRDHIYTLCMFYP